MILFLVSYLILFATFLCSVYVNYKQYYEVKKYRRQRDDLIVAFYNNYGLYQLIPNGITKVLDEIEGWNVAPRK